MNPPQIQVLRQQQSYQRNPNAESIAYDEYPQNNAQLITNTYVQQQQQQYKPSTVVRGRHREYRPIPIQLPPQFAQQFQNIRNLPQGGIKIGEGQSGSFISFPLPGNGAHFYFLTPQVIKDDNIDRDNGGYLYPEPNQRLRRRSRQRHRTNDQVYRQR